MFNSTLASCFCARGCFFYCVYAYLCNVWPFSSVCVCICVYLSLSLSLPGSLVFCMSCISIAHPLTDVNVWLFSSECVYVCVCVCVVVCVCLQGQSLACIIGLGKTTTQCIMGLVASGSSC